VRGLSANPTLIEFAEAAPHPNLLPATSAERERITAPAAPK
jgi:hypothetical protein